MNTKPEARDVFWCWIVNEPAVIEFQGDFPKCTLCNWVDSSATEGVASRGFLAEHTFCCHVVKPRQVAHAP